MKKLHFLLLGNCTFLSGIFFAGLISLNDFSIYLYAGFFLSAVFLIWFFKLGINFILTLLILFSFAVLRFVLTLPSIDEKNLSFYNHPEREISVTACISDEVDRRRDHQKLTLDSMSVSLNGETKVVQGKLLVTVPKFPEYDYSQCMNLKGILQDPGQFEGFSYDNYLARYGVYSVMYRPRVDLLDFKRGNLFFEILFNVKQGFEAGLNSLLHEPHSSFAAGLISGSRRGIPEKLMEAFNLTGLTHIIAISGYNITLLIIIVSALFGFLSRFWRFFLSSALIVVFVFFVGASAAVVRAALMGIIGLMAIQFGRKSFVLLLLFFSAALMNLYNPYILYTDVGFQLSFAATLGLIVFADKFEKYFTFLPDFFAIRESMIMTMAAQVFTLPLIVYHFGRMSLISPLANVLTGPLIPFAMLFSFLAVISSYLWRGSSIMFSFLAWIFLEAIIKIAQVLASLPFSSLDF